MLIGVRLQDGKIYYWKRSFFLFLYSIVVSIFLLGVAVAIGGVFGNFILPILGAIALIFFTTKPFIMQTLVYQPKLSSLGGIAPTG